MLVAKYRFQLVLLRVGIGTTRILKIQYADFFPGEGLLRRTEQRRRLRQGSVHGLNQFPPMDELPVGDGDLVLNLDLRLLDLRVDRTQPRPTRPDSG